jgi:glycosyltransferase involved in cell wall biosynthesis
MFNEEANAERCVRRICDVLASIPYKHAIIAINDGSLDGTGDILKGLQHEFPDLIVLTHERNGGYGHAVATGLKAAATGGFEYALFMDSDLTNDPKYIHEFVRKMEDNVDVIKASRYIRGGGVMGVPLHRRIISISGNTIARVLMGLPISDCTNGFRAVRVSLLSHIPLTEPGFEVIMEELYHCKRLARTFAEVPYILTSRGRAKGLSKFAYRPQVFGRYLKYVFLAALVRQRV